MQICVELDFLQRNRDPAWLNFAAVYLLHCKQHSLCDPNIVPCMSHICEVSLDGFKTELSGRYVKIKRLVPTTTECQDSVFEG